MYPQSMLAANAHSEDANQHWHATGFIIIFAYTFWIKKVIKIQNQRLLSSMFDFFFAVNIASIVNVVIGKSSAIGRYNDCFP